MCIEIDVLLQMVNVQSLYQKELVQNLTQSFKVGITSSMKKIFHTTGMLLPICYNNDKVVPNNMPIVTTDIYKQMDEEYGKDMEKLFGPGL